jgi:hypothetical protein
MLESFITTLVIFASMALIAFALHALVRVLTWCDARRIRTVGPAVSLVAAFCAVWVAVYWSYVAA